jgi:hypothetical protein
LSAVSIDAVAAHEHGQCLALLVEHGRFHGFAVQLTELEDMTHLDAARDIERAAAARGGIAFLHIADVLRDGIGQIASPVHAGEVHILFVGAAHEIVKVRCRMIHV